MAVGGWNELIVRYLQAVPNQTYPNTTCGIPRQDSWIMLRDPINSDMPWPGFLLGQTPSSIWYWCADQVRQHCFQAINLHENVNNYLDCCVVRVNNKERLEAW